MFASLGSEVCLARLSFNGLLHFLAFEVSLHHGKELGIVYAIVVVEVYFLYEALDFFVRYVQATTFHAASQNVPHFVLCNEAGAVL